MLMFAIEKYITIARVKKFLTHRSTCVVYIGIWTTLSCGIFVFKLHPDFTGPTSKMASCLFGPHGSLFRIFLGVCGLVDMGALFVVTVMYCLVLNSLWKSHKTVAIGHKHGRRTLGSIAIRLGVVMIVSLLAMIVSSVIKMILAFGPSVENTHSLIVVFVVLELFLGSPIAFVLVKRRFVISAQTCFTKKILA